MTIGHYRIIEPLGGGGMAEVFKAHDPRFDRYVALKVVLPALAREPGFQQRFEQEAKAVGRLNHRNILTVYDFGEDHGLDYLVSDLVEGGSLAARITQPWPVPDAVALLTPIAAALDYAHQRGVLHRDIKPANILLRADGTPVLADFGIAKLTDSTATLSTAGMVVGTPAYMAPELGHGLPAGPASDQYALTVVAYELLTGRVPYQAETPWAVMLAHMSKPLPMPRALNPQISRAVETVLLKGLAKEPGDRYANASAFTAALADVAQAAPTPTPPTVVSSQPMPEAPGGAAPTALYTPQTAAATPLPPAPVTEASASLAQPLAQHQRGGQARSTMRARLLFIGTIIVGVIAIIIALEVVPQRTRQQLLANVPPVAAAQTPTGAGSAWTPLATMTTGRWRHAAVVGRDGVIYVFGGESANGILFNAEAYTPSTNSWKKLANMPTARSGLAAAVGPDGKIYVVGGANGKVIHAEMEVYDPASDSWTEAAPLPTPRTGLAAATGADGRIYALGGGTNGTNGHGVLPTVEVYAPATNSWSAGPDLPTPREDLAAAVGSDGRIYTIGGSTGSDPLKNVESLAQGSSSWDKAAGLRNPSFVLAALTGADGRIYAIGGSDGTVARGSFDVYTPSTNEWKPLPPLQSGRSGLAAVGINGAIYVIGGRLGESYSDSLEVYRP
jgi:N-acetylneuraminic acid mutarotase